MLTKPNDFRDTESVNTLKGNHHFDARSFCGLLLLLALMSICESLLVLRYASSLLDKIVNAGRTCTSGTA